METGRERPTTAATMSTQLSIVDSGAFSPSSQQAQEMDFNNTQLRLVREQTANCIKDLNALRAEVMLLKSEVESDRLTASAAASSMEGKQIEVQEHFEREKRERDCMLQQLSRKVHDLDRDLPSIRDEMTLMREQIRALETAWHPHIQDLQATFLKDAEARHQAHGLLEQRISEIDAGMAKHSALHKEQMANHMPLASRVEFLEKSLGDSAAKHGQEIQDAHQKITDLHGLNEHSEKKHSSLQERMNMIENLLGYNVQKHSEELKKTQDRLSELRGKLGVAMPGNMRSGETQVTVESRLKYLEQSLEELSYGHGKIEALHGRLGHLEAKGVTVDELKHNFEKQGSALEDLKSSHTTLSTQKSTLDLHHATLKERVDYLESMMGDSADHHKKVTEEHKANHAKLANELRAREASHASLADRVGYMEQRMGDSFAKHAQELATAMAKMDAVHGRVSEERVAREAHVASLESLKKAHGSLASEKQVLEKHHATLEERLDYLEKALGDSSDKHTRELDALKAAHQKVASEQKSKEHSHGQVSDRLSQLQREKEDLHARHMSLGERVDYLEKLLGESAEKHTQEIERFKAKHAKDLDASASKLQSHHAGLQERLEYLEGKLGDSADKHSKELSTMEAKMQELHGKLQDEKNNREDKLLQMSGHIRDQVSGEQKTREERHASIEERLKFLESTIGDNADKHNKGLEEHGKGVKALTEKHEGSVERLDFIEKTLGVSVEKQTKDLSSFLSQQLRGNSSQTAPVQERLDYLEKMLGDSAALNQKITDLHGLTEHSQQKHASVQERMDFIEKLLGDSVQMHGEELRRTQDRLSEMQGKIGVGKPGMPAGDIQVTVESRLKYLEQMLGDSEAKHQEELKNAHGQLQALHGRLGNLEERGVTVDQLKQNYQRQGSALEDLKSSHANLSSGKLTLDSHHATLKERMDYLESMMGDSADLHNKVLQQHSKLSNEMRTALDDLKSSHAKLSSDKLMSDSHHSTLKERVDYLESTMGDSADHHKQAIAEHKATQQKLAKELRAREASHASLADRMGYIEEHMGDSFEKHAKELAAAVAKMDAMRGQVSEERVAREAHVASLESLKKAHGNLASEKQALEMHHATLAERIDYLEKALGDSSDKHSREQEALRKAHQKALAEHKGKEQSLMQIQREKDELHGSLGERVSHLEKVLGESAEELEKFKAKHAKLDAGANKLQSHHAGMQERLEYLESMLGDSADKHAKELSIMQSKVHDLHGKLHDEKRSGEAHELHAKHTSLGERVGYLEKVLGESAEKHMQELENFKAKHAKLDAGANKLQSHHAGMQERLEYLESMLGDSADKHAKELTIMQSKMQELHGKLQDEKNSREEKLLHITGHLREQVSVQKQKEERHASMEERLKFVELLIGDNADKHKKTIEEHGQGMKALHEKHAGVAERLDLMEKEEQAARLQIEEMVRRETQERHKHHETQSELVDSLQRTVGIFDVLIRKDMEERKLEMKHLWEAIDGHTHDLNSKVKAIGSDTEDLEDETRLRPRVIARSSPSLPGVVSPSVRSANAGGTSPRVVTYRPAVLPASQARVVSYPTTVLQAPAPAPFALQSSTRSELVPAAAGRSLSPSRRMDHSEVVCGKARYYPERAHGAEIPMMP